MERPGPLFVQAEVTGFRESQVNKSEAADGVK